MVFSLGGAFGALALVMAAAASRRRASVQTIILVGVVVNAFFGAAILLTVALLNPVEAHKAVLWMMGESLSNRPLLLLGVLLMLVGIQVLSTGLIGEMITYKGFRRSDTYSVRELLE